MREKTDMELGGFMNIKSFREKYGLSREDIASRVGVSHMTVYRWEKNKVNPRRIGLMALERLKDELEKSKKSA